MRDSILIALVLCSLSVLRALNNLATSITAQGLLASLLKRGKIEHGLVEGGPLQKCLARMLGAIGVTKFPAERASSLPTRPDF